MRSFARALDALSFEPTVSRLFAGTPWDEVARLAHWVATADPFHEHAALKSALQIAGGDDIDPFLHIEHQLWCAWREAAWIAGVATPLPVTVKGEAWLAETEGHPTIVISPMTLASVDALHVVSRVKGPRPCIVYGEHVALQQVVQLELDGVDSESGGTVRRIREVLLRGGMLCTYPDFVYAGHRARSMQLFGTIRPVASGFLTLAAMPDTMLLPVMCCRSDGEIVVSIDEPMYVPSATEPETRTRSDAREAIADAVGAALEGLIHRAPEQWRLLATLTFESPQMSTARADRADLQSSSATASGVNTHRAPFHGHRTPT